MTDSTKTMFPQIRVEKSGNKNKDDFRVLLSGIILCILLIFGQKTYSVFYDSFIAERPFLKTTTLEIIHVDTEVEPLILYDADPNQNVTGTWIASVFAEDGTRLNSRRGEGNYFVEDDIAKYWAWTAWFDNEQSDPPVIPEVPFYVCVRYDLKTNDSSVVDSTPYTCSPIYDPKNPTRSLKTYIERDTIR